MSLLQVVGEEEIPDDGIEGYFTDIYRVVCVSERPSNADRPGALLRTTYVVDWEQLVHLLEGYDEFQEDIVEVTRLPAGEAELWRSKFGDELPLARA